MLIVAEIGSQHKGNQHLAYEMIRRTAEAGADIAKFQIGWPESDTLRHIDSFAGFLKDSCDHFGVEFLASIWSLEGLTVAQILRMNRYKISNQIALSGEPLFEHIIADGKETFVSAPSGGKKYKNVRWIYTVSQYPTYPKDLHLPRAFGEDEKYYGYSSHTHGIGDALIAISRGAEYIEKHCTLDRELVTRDASFAITFEELGELVRLGREIERLR